ncbi:MAG TPA: hypothetical protein VNJ08_08765 [Bacteriovoracaceae bacterium]|nr:hypothetical protein [Bacteriovoracaceae bacterium]
MMKVEKIKKMGRKTVIPWSRWGKNNILIVQWFGYSDKLDRFGKRLLIFKVVGGSVTGFPTKSGQDICLYSTKLLKDQIKYINEGTIISINYGGIHCGEKYDYHLIKVFSNYSLDQT